MIRYALNCQTGHEFEAWFRSSEDYDEQRELEIIHCPACGTHKVEKAIMAPSVRSGIRSKSGSDIDQMVNTPTTEHPQVAPAPAAAPNDQTTEMHGLNLPDQGEMVEAVRKYRDAVMEQAEDVGEKFADEARKIHYEEEPARGIYGKATREEVEDLLEEGVEIAPLPVLPEDNN